MTSNTKPWRDGFFVTADGHKPGEAWLASLPVKPATEVVAVVMAVTDAPPPAFAGGGKWEAMHGEMGASTRYGADRATCSTDCSVCSIVPMLQAQRS